MGESIFCTTMFDLMRRLKIDRAAIMLPGAGAITGAAW